MFNPNIVINFVKNVTEVYIESICATQRNFKSYLYAITIKQEVGFNKFNREKPMICENLQLNDQSRHHIYNIYT